MGATRQGVKRLAQIRSRARDACAGFCHTRGRGGGMAAGKERHDIDRSDQGRPSRQKIENLFGLFEWEKVSLP
jgi:hypothetical protein